MHSRHAIVPALLVAGLWCGGAGSAVAQDWPTRPVTMVVPFAAGGGTDYFCTLSATAKSQIESGLIKPLAILTRERSSMLPKLATAQEQGLKDFEASTWFGFFLPARTPSPIIHKLKEATVAAMETPTVQERLREVGTTIVAPERRSPDYLQKFVASEIAKNAAPIKAAGIAME